MIRWLLRMLGRDRREREVSDLARRDVAILRRVGRLAPGDQRIEAEIRRAEEVLRGHGHG